MENKKLNELIGKYNEALVEKSKCKCGSLALAMGDCPHLNTVNIRGQILLNTLVAEYRDNQTPNSKTVEAHFEKGFDYTVTETKEHGCKLDGQPCDKHAGMVRGKEAEELRRGIEKILEDYYNVVEVLDHDIDVPLRRLLDETDARDSLAFLETQPEPDPWIAELVRLAGEFRRACVAPVYGAAPQKQALAALEAHAYNNGMDPRSTNDT